MTNRVISGIKEKYFSEVFLMTVAAIAVAVGTLLVGF